MRQKLIKTTPSGTIPERIQFAKNDAANIKKHEVEATGIPNNDVKITVLTDKIDADVILHDEGDDAAGKRVLVYLAEYEDMYFHNVFFVEDKINISGDPNLANLLNYEFYQKGGPGNKAAIKGKNTNNKGEIQIDILRVIMEGSKPKFAHHYDIYGALVTDEGAGIDAKIGQLFKAKGLIKGLNSGDKYSIYAIPVDIDGNEGKPTPSFVIRIS
ncbi:MAG: hypothetical protein WCL51_00505 [Bacteroidota bacterium]